MASIKFNPFTGKFDYVGSGGGASYIDGEVEYHSSLPVTVGSPAVNSAFLVRKGQGFYFLTRKPAGIWVRELNNGNLDDWKYAGTFSDLYRDANFRIINDTDTSKELAFSLSGIATGTTRTITMPNANVTLPNQGTSTGDSPTFAQLNLESGSAAGALVVYEEDGDTIFDFVANGNAGMSVTPADVRFAVPISVPDSANQAATRTGLGLGTAATANLDALPETLRIVGGTDPTRKLAFELDTLVSTATTRTLTVPNASGTIALNETFAAPPAIGNTTPAAGSFTTLAANNGTLTASAPVLDLAQTWDDQAVFTASASGTTLTVSAVASGTIRVGMFCHPSGFPGNERTIAALGTGTGGTGTYILNAASGIGSSITWTGVVNTFKALVVNANSTASLSTSSVLEAQVNGSRVFNINRNGHVTLGGEIDFTRNNSTANRITSPSATKLTISCAGGGSIEMFGSGYGGQNMTFKSIAGFIFEGNGDYIEQRRGANGQTYRLYNTFTDASNHERLSLRWASNVAIIGTEKAGTGSARALEFQTDGTTRLTIATTGAATFSGALSSVGINASGGPISTNQGLFLSSTSMSAAAIFGTLDITTNAAGLRLYGLGSNVGGGATNTERLHISTRTGASYFISTQATGTGTVRALELRTNDVARLTLEAAGGLTIADANDIAVGTTTGTKIGTATNQKIGFFNATPVVQQAAVADATDAASTQARLNDLLARLRTLGLIAT